MAPSPRELALFLHAFRLVRRAQAVDRQPVPDLAASLARLRALPRGVDPDDALVATLRATSRGARWFGWRGTCLVKALVLSALLSDHDDVELVLGVRSGRGDPPIDGHAWVRVAGRELSLFGPRDAADDGYATITSLRVRADGARGGPAGPR